MSKLIFIWCVMIGLMMFTILSYAQAPIIVLDPDGNVKSIVIMPLPAPTR